MPAETYARLRAYYSVEPFGVERDNMHVALLAAASENRFQMLHVKKSKQKFVGPSKYMLGRHHQPIDSKSKEQAASKLSEHLLRGTSHDRSSQASSIARSAKREVPNPARE